jgi:hypothetical protein
MRNMGAVVALAILVLLGLLVFLYYGPMTERPGMRDVTVDTSQPGPTAPQAKGPAAAKEKRQRQTPAAEPESVEVAAANVPQTPSPAAQTPVSHAARRFPTAADIPIGMERGRLQNGFGKPNMRTTVVEGGRLLETFVYLQSEPDVATFVLLRNGKVVSANTTIY